MRLHKLYTLIRRRVHDAADRLCGASPFVSRIAYLDVCKLAADLHTERSGLRTRVYELEHAAIEHRRQRESDVVLINELNQKQQGNQKRITDLCLQCDHLRRELMDEQGQSGRLAQLLRAVNVILERAKMCSSGCNPEDSNGNGER